MPNPTVYIFILHMHNCTAHICTVIIIIIIVVSFLFIFRMQPLKWPYFAYSCFIYLFSNCWHSVDSKRKNVIVQGNMFLYCAYDIKHFEYAQTVSCYWKIQPLKHLIY